MLFFLQQRDVSKLTRPAVPYDKARASKRAFFTIWLESKSPNQIDAEWTEYEFRPCTIEDFQRVDLEKVYTDTFKYE